MPDDPTVKLCECGCGQPAPIATRTISRQGQFAGQPNRFINGHQARYRKHTRTIRERFEEKYVVDEDTGCWLWTGALDNSGYGSFGTGVGRKTDHAQRVSYELHVGPIPSGLTIDHTCHNGSGCSGGKTCLHRRCVNPAHLEAVSNVENILRGESPAARNARKTHCFRGHEFTEENTSVNPRGARNCRACNREDSRRSYHAKKALAG